MDDGGIRWNVPALFHNDRVSFDVPCTCVCLLCNFVIYTVHGLKTVDLVRKETHLKFLHLHFAAIVLSLSFCRGQVCYDRSS